MQTHSHTLESNEPTLIGIKPALEAVFPDAETRPVGIRGHLSDNQITPLDADSHLILVSMRAVTPSIPHDQGPQFVLSATTRGVTTAWLA